MLHIRVENATWVSTEDGGTVVLDLRTSKYLSLNGSGSVLWSALVAGGTEVDLARSLVDAFGIPADTAAADVEVFLAALRSRELLAET